jgi:opacity protein-like surface antigen
MELLMKKSCALLLFLITPTAFAGQMGEISTPNTSYIFINGGYYGSMYQKLDADYEDGLLETMTASDAAHSDGYGQIGIGTESRINQFVFDQQLSVLKLGGSNVFTSPHSSNKFKQNIDFGYDFMPKIALFKQLNAYGLLGVHYAQFKYEKKPLNGTGVYFNHLKDQIGFNLGAGFNYQMNPNFILGVKYQHLQYNRAKVYGSSAANTAIDAEQFTPAFNLVGAELRYYWDKAVA